MSWLFASVGQSIGTSASESVLPINIQSWCCLGLTGLISCSPVDSQESSLIPQFKSINYLSLNLLYGPTLTSKCDYWKNYSFGCMDLCWQSNISGFNMLSRFITAFLPRRKCFFFVCLFFFLFFFKFHGCSYLLQWNLESKKIKSLMFPLFPHLFSMKWWDQFHDLCFLNVEY